MFIGHFGLAFALKRAEPRTSLGTLFVAVQWVDILWALFLLLGWEHVDVVPGFTPVSPFDFLDYPLSHSLLAAVVWSGLFGAAYYSWPTSDTSRHLKRTLVVMVAVASHWFLDLIAHVPDLPLLGNDSTKVGLGLWRSLPATLAVESLLLAGGIFILLRRPSRQHPPRPVRILALAGFLLGIYLLSVFGPPPPSAAVVAWTVLAGAVLLLALAIWADRPAPAPASPQPKKS